MPLRFVVLVACVSILPFGNTCDPTHRHGLDDRCMLYNPFRIRMFGEVEEDNRTKIPMPFASVHGETSLKTHKAETNKGDHAKKCITVKNKESAHHVARYRIYHLCDAHRSLYRSRHSYRIEIAQAQMCLEDHLLSTFSALLLTGACTRATILLPVT